ncbi:MAG: DNA adenine methylase [Deltaproteobacteria bacterium]|nr:MAG: DNA adenine methylase [Deltaproteobacteria bacterium]
MSTSLFPVQRRAPRQDAEPVVKWAGGKTRLVPQITALFPATWGRYYEPFLGGAAMFLALQPGGAVLTDINDDLITLYQVVQNDVEALIADLQRHRYEKNYYYAVRAQDPTRLGRVQRASRTLYLNRTCFNGLYRVNRRGEFNVPFGRYKNPTIVDEDRLRAVSSALNGCTVAHMDYATATATAKAGDLVYFDPPYFPLTRTSNFTSYTAGAFGPDDQRRLAEVFDDLTDRGVACLQSNSDTPFIRDLYSHHRVHTVTAHRAISRDPSTRGTVTEVVIANF